MNIDAAITFLISGDNTTLEIYDRASSVTFVKINLDPVQLSKILSRLSFVSCDAEVFGLEKVGKTMENKIHEFEIPTDLTYANKSDESFMDTLAKKNYPGRMGK